MHVLKSLILLSLLFSASVYADVDTHRAAGAEARAAGDFKEAVSHFKAVVKELPEDGAAHYNLGAVLMDMGKPKAAIKHFQKARDLQFQAQGAGYRLARIYGRIGQNEKALQEVEAIAAAGFMMPQLIEGEADLEALKGESRFQAALATITGNRYPCQNNPGAHAFDFWIGQWDVNQAGVAVGTNKIEPILGHCTLLENWTSVSGTEGKSFNYYDAGYDRWRQIWISDTGNIIEFHGEARDGGIYYAAETRNPADGVLTYHRLEFTVNDDGSVRQHWLQSTDERETWATVWDAQYVRTTADRVSQNK